MSRPPERIPRVLALLEEYWTRYPDLRLAQIVVNAVGVNSVPEVFHAEDDQVDQWLRDRVSQPDMVKAARPPCDCELRNRAWDPNTGRCRTCGRAYHDPRTAHGADKG